MAQLTNHSTANGVRAALCKGGRVYESVSNSTSGWNVDVDPEFYGGVIVSYQESSITTYSGVSREASIASSYRLYTEILEEAGYKVEQRADGTLSVHTPSELERDLVRSALAEAREAVEGCSMDITTRKAAPWSIWVIYTDTAVPERTRRGELSFDLEAGYKFRTFFYWGERTRDLVQVVKEVTEELLAAE
jgi:hypothetical protein